MIPKKITVKGQEYKVTITELPSSHYGLTHVYNKTIHVCNKKNNNETDLLKVFAHELCHAYFDEFNLSSVISDDNEELVCMMMEELLESILPIIYKMKKNGRTKR